jgi:hypothetical protein
MAEEKSGKVKFTFEMELNQPVMELIRQDIDIMMDLAAQGADVWRKNMVERRGKGHGMGMMMHNGQE